MSIRYKLYRFHIYILLAEVRAMHLAPTLDSNTVLERHLVNDSLEVIPNNATLLKETKEGLRH